MKKVLADRNEDENVGRNSCYPISRGKRSNPDANAPYPAAIADYISHLIVIATTDQSMYQRVLPTQRY